MYFLFLQISEEAKSKSRFQRFLYTFKRPTTTFCNLGLLSTKKKKKKMDGCSLPGFVIKIRKKN